MDVRPVDNAIGRIASVAGGLKARWIREAADAEAHQPIAEVVDRRGTAGYRAWTALVREVTNDIYFDYGGWQHVSAGQRMQANLRSAWDKAWNDGIKEFGLTMADLSAEELLTLNAAKASDGAAVPGFISFVNGNRASSQISHIENGEALSRGEWVRRASKLSLYDKVNARQRLWWNAYHRVTNQARQLAAGDRPMTWVLGKAEHCVDCLNYAGRVYRATTWAKWDIRPQHPSLACHGVNCQCRLMVTDQPITKGRPPAMTG